MICVYYPENFCKQEKLILNKHPIAYVNLYKVELLLKITDETSYMQTVIKYQLIKITV